MFVLADVSCSGTLGFDRHRAVLWREVIALLDGSVAASYARPGPIVQGNGKRHGCHRVEWRPQSTV